MIGIYEGGRELWIPGWEKESRGFRYLSMILERWIKLSETPETSKLILKPEKGIFLSIRQEHPSCCPSLSLRYGQLGAQQTCPAASPPINLGGAEAIYRAEPGFKRHIRGPALRALL